MSDLTELTIDGHDLMFFRNRLPLHIILIFNDSDLVEEDEDLSDEELHTRYIFKTTVEHALDLLNNRGITSKFVTEQFELLKEPLLVSPTDRETDVPNPINFRTYVMLVSKNIFEQSIDTPIAPEIERLWRFNDTNDIWSFWRQDARDDLGDLIDVICIRAYLEAAPAHAAVQLDVSYLHWYEDRYKDIYREFVKRAEQRIQLDYLIYGFALEEDPTLESRLKKIIQALNENDFINFVLIPLLQELGFVGVKPVSHHGPGELGKDILPFRRITEFGTYQYIAVQAKAVKIHGTASKPGNTAEVANQVFTALKAKFMDELDNEVKKLDQVIIATSKEISPDAKAVLDDSIEGSRSIIYLDIHRIIELVRKHNLTKYVLFGIRP